MSKAPVIGRDPISDVLPLEAAPVVVAATRPQRRAIYPLIEGVVVSAVAAALAVMLWGTPLLKLVPVAAAMLLIAETAALPAYDRSTSLVPLRRLVVRASLVLLVAAAAGWIGLSDLRIALGSVGLVLVLPFAVRGIRWLLPTARSTLLVGDRVGVSHLVAQWRARAEVRIVGICLTAPDDDAEDLPDQMSGVPVLGRLGDAVSLAKDHAVAQVVVSPGPALTAYDVRRLSWALEDSNIELAVAAEVHGAVPRRIEPRLLGRRLLLSVRPTRRPRAAVLLKSLIDRSLGALLLVLFAPVLAFLMILVRWDSAGPALFRQVRAGQGGRAFTMYKLRTMAADAEQRRHELETLNEGAGPLFKILHDPRITDIGRVLRRTSLDELPQLWNVVRGDMSLIGPRPALPMETDSYDAWIRRRLSVKPGMTGLWQVSGRSELGWNEAVRLDLDYVDNWTLASDLAIAGRTVRAVVRADGAA